MNKAAIFPSLLCTICLLTGCMTSTGVMQTGKDMYTVVVDGSGTAFVGQGKLMKRALSDANSFCQQQGKVMVPTFQSYSPGSHDASYELRFLAVSPDDPAADKRTSPADSVVEIREGAR